MVVAPGPEKLDLDVFTSADDALDQAEEAARRYDAVAQQVLAVGGFTLRTLFFMSLVTRCRGLHEAIVREARNTNPYAVWPLMRALAETAVLLVYVIDHPDYVDDLSDKAGTTTTTTGRKRKRKSQQALIAYAKKHIKNAKPLYAELSEATHFGSIAFWSAHTLEDGNRFSWGSEPRWKDDKDLRIACAQVLELSEGIAALLKVFGRRHLVVKSA